MTMLDSIQPRRIGHGSPVVLLHGVGESRQMWDGLAALADRHELISYDFRGHGEAAFEIEDLSAQLEAMLASNGITRAHIAGSSLGGMVAIHFAATWPNRVDRLVLCDTSPALSEGMREDYLAAGDPARAAMARADLMDFAEEIFAATLVLCAEGADLALREGADFLARSIPFGRFAFVPGAREDSVRERPNWVAQALLDFLT